MLNPTLVRRSLVIDESQATTTSSAWAVTTTFTAPASCTQRHLTILENRAYEVWLNEPLPVPATTMAACYPTMFVSSYLRAQTEGSVPALSPFACPNYYKTAFSTGKYVACCPESFTLGQGTASFDSARPAYGKTCYSDISEVTVTAYDNKSVSATSLLVFSTTGAQAYAHLMDGYLAMAEATAESSQIAATASPGSTLLPVASSTSSANASHNLSRGAVAGITIAALASFLFLLGAFWLLYRRRRQQQQQQQLHQLQQQQQQQRAARGGMLEMEGSRAYWAGRHADKPAGFHATELEEDRPPPPPPKFEMGTRLSRYEMETEFARHEMPGSPATPVELPNEAHNVI